MVDPVEVLWTPAGASLPSLGARALVDITDGDTPNIRMPVRMLSVDTPEVTARSANGAGKVDTKFLQLADWIKQDKAPVSKSFAQHILPKLETGNAGTLQFEQGQAASAWFKARAKARLKRPTGNRRRNLFIRTSETPFDGNQRLLAYVAPSYTAKERKGMSRRERATFNLDLIESGWGAPFIIFPNIPGERDLPLFLELASEAEKEKRGQLADPLSLPAFEYRMCESLYRITARIVGGEALSYAERLGWRSRYAADMRTRILYGPEGYMPVLMQYRIWIWPQDVQGAMAALNLKPSPDLTS